MPGSVGADGALLISPYYNKPTQEGIVAHYEAIARDTGFPLVVYNIPGRTASNILPETLARLADVEHVVGVKEACGDIAQISEVVARCPEAFVVLSGDDALTLPVLAVGGRGVISTASNVAPREVVELVRAFRAGDHARALQRAPTPAAALQGAVLRDESDSGEGRARASGPHPRRDPAAAHEAHAGEPGALQVALEGAGARLMRAPRRVLVVGACGRMGERVRAALAGEPSLRLAAALEAPGHPQLGSELAPGVLLRDDVKAALARRDVAIDFSHPAASLPVLRAAAEAGVAYVMGTTGLSGDERAELALAARRIPVLHSPNFSVSVNVLVWLVREAARRLGSGYDAEILEMHHAGKRDAPSGTALRLAEAIAEGRGHPLEGHLVLERAGETGARVAGSIGIQALRAGDSRRGSQRAVRGRGRAARARAPRADPRSFRARRRARRGLARRSASRASTASSRRSISRARPGVPARARGPRRGWPGDQMSK